MTEKQTNAMFSSMGGWRGGRRNFLWRLTQSLIALTCKLGAATRRAEYGHDIQSWGASAVWPRTGVGGEERVKMLSQSSTVLEPNFLRSSDHREVAVTIPGKILLELLW